MPQVNFQNNKFKVVSAVVIVFLAIITGILLSSLHKIHEGNVGVYYKHGALQDRTTGPGKLYNIFSINSIRLVIRRKLKFHLKKDPSNRFQSAGEERKINLKYLKF